MKWGSILNTVETAPKSLFPHFVSDTKYDFLISVSDSSDVDSSGPTFWAKRTAGAAHQLCWAIAWAKQFLKYPERFWDR